MTTEFAAKEIRAAFPELKLLETEPMKNHCSFRIGGPAELFAEPASEEELTGLVALLRRLDVKTTVIGRGTNLLVRDEGVAGAVIRLGEKLSAIRFDGEELYAESGVSLAQLAVAAQQQGLSGLEFAHGIPGSLGGAVFMNAGAYGGEMKDVVTAVRYLDEEGRVRETADGGFSYRRSRFSDGKSVILGARLRLQRGDKQAIFDRMRELMEKRAASQPLDKPSAGSTFKRPAVGYAAAMIEGAGLKGLRVGGAQVSEKHSGFVINVGGATFGDVTALMEQVQRAVFDKYAVLLEPEVRIIG
ncbi:MAG: UDP-N-acetylmuramate dehydrogenase [Oscillospiraceae bacterium]